MKIFIINLPSVIERRQFQEEQLSKLDLDYEILKATSIDDISDEKYDKHYFDWQRPLKNTEVACYFSHRSAWKKIIDSNKPALILEDDALLSKYTAEILDSVNELSHIDLLQLEVRSRKKLIKKQGVKISSTHIMYRLYQDRTGAAGYVLWPSGAKKLLEHERLNGIGLADAHITSCYSIESYQVEPAVVMQLDQCHCYSVNLLNMEGFIRSSVSSAKNPKGPFYFWIKRISAQLKMGFHAVKILNNTNSSKRFIKVRSDDFL
jgi:glycosyl transferase family 25